jgi:capsular polysaccharide biosynthesis protein
MRFITRLLKYWPIYLILLIAVPVVVTFYGVHKLTMYESNVTLYAVQPHFLTDFQSQNAASYLSPAQGVQTSMEELLQTHEFVAKVASASPQLAREYDLKSSAGQDAVFSRLSGNITITVPSTGRSVVLITVDDKEAVVTQQVASTLITQFNAYFTQSQLALDAQAETFFKQQLTAVQAKVADDSAQLNAYVRLHPELKNANRLPDAQYDQLKQTYDQDSATAQQLTGNLGAVKLDEAEANAGNSNLTVLDQPKVPTSPTLKINKVLFYPLGGLAAVLALIALIVSVQNYLDRGVYSERDVLSIIEGLDWNAPAVEVFPQLGAPAPKGKRGSAQDGEGTGLPSILVPVLAALPRTTERGDRVALQTTGATDGDADAAASTGTTQHMTEHTTEPTPGAATREAAGIAAGVGAGSNLSGEEDR